MLVFNDVDEALASDLKDKDVVKIYVNDQPEFYVYTFDFVTREGELKQFFVDMGLYGLPDAKLMPDNYILACAPDVWATHDGYWVQFLGGDLSTYKPTLDIHALMSALTTEFEGSGPSISFVNDRLMLTLSISNKVTSFYVGQDELRDINKVVSDIKALIGQSDG